MSAALANIVLTAMIESALAACTALYSASEFTDVLPATCLTRRHSRGVSSRFLAELAMAMLVAQRVVVGPFLGLAQGYLMVPIALPGPLSGPSSCEPKCLWI